MVEIVQRAGQVLVAQDGLHEWEVVAAGFVHVLGRGAAQIVGGDVPRDARLAEGAVEVLPQRCDRPSSAVRVQEPNVGDERVGVGGDAREEAAQLRSDGQDLVGSELGGEGDGSLLGVVVLGRDAGRRLGAEREIGEQQRPAEDVTLEQPEDGFAFGVGDGYGTRAWERDAREELRYGFRTVVGGEVVEDAAVVGAEAVPCTLREVASLGSSVERVELIDFVGALVAADRDDVTRREIGVAVGRGGTRGVGVAEDKTRDARAAVSSLGRALPFCSNSYAVAASGVVKDLRLRIPRLSRQSA